jgi:hypothetical protein
MVTRIAGAQVANYGGEHYPGLQQASDLLREYVFSNISLCYSHMLFCSTITNIGGRAQYWNEMQEFLAFVQFQGISEEIKAHFSALDSCLTMFSVRLFSVAAQPSVANFILLSTLPTSLKISGLASLAPFSVKS